MPRISTKAQLDGSVFGPGNVSTPGILTGVEPLLLLQRLAPQFAVFVIEKRLGLVKLAMHLHDYAPAIESGRLVLIPENQLGQAFETFFKMHPGYEFPLHLLTAIQRTPNEIADLREQLETVAARITADQREAAGAIAESIAAANTENLTAAPRLVILTVDTNPEMWHVASQVASAAERLGWTATCCVPDAPRKCHIVARLQTVADLRANLVLFLGGGSAALRPLLPESLPIASWFLPTSTVHAGLPPAAGTRDLILAASHHVREQLETIGVSSNHIQDLPVGATPLPVVKETALATARREARQLSAVVLANLPTTAPQACGIGLPSHVTLWRALLQLAMDEAKPRHTLDLDTLFERAQQDSDTTLDDPGLMARLRATAAAHIVPVAETAAILETATASGCDLSLYGNELSGLAGAGQFCGAIPSLEALGDVLREADAVLLPVADARSMAWSVNALACGTAVLCRPSPVFHPQCSTMLEMVLGAIHWFDNTEVLGAMLRDIGSDVPTFRTAHGHAAHDLRSNHDLAARLRYIHRQTEALVDTAASQASAP